MRINNNLNAMTALNQMGRNTALAGTSMNKIASGERINKAGDDAAGMAISEKMRGQIRGLDQASKNAQDGISVVQTAEGAMEEIGNITQRMRELSVQAANETNKVEDREKITTELKQLHSEIDRIAESTQFNGKQLLSNGVKGEGVAVDAKSTKDAAKTAIASITTTGFDKEVDGDIKLSVNRNAALDTAYTAADTAYNAAKTASDADPADATLAEATAKALEKKNEAEQAALEGTKFEVEIDGTKFEATLSKDGKNIIAKDGDKEVNIELATAITGSAAITVGNGISNTLEDIGDIKVELNNKNANISGTGVSSSEIKGFTDEKFKNSTIELKKGTTGYELKILDKDGKTLATAAEVNITNGKLTFNSIDDENGDALVSHSIELTVDSAKLDAQATLDSLGKVSLEFKTSNDDLNLNLQIGANTGSSESLNVKIANMSTGALGLGKADIEALENIDLAKGSEAAKALVDKLDAALETVNTSRADLGATQNRLETAQSNLTTSSENLTAAESRIRDVDVAKEMMNLSKLNLLSQASQAMAGQAKQQPEGVMQLLR